MLTHHLVDGSARPGWAGPVAHVPRSGGAAPRGGPDRNELSGIVLPIRVHNRFLPTTPAGDHTFGLGLGFPDLSDHFLSRSRKSGLAGNWGKVENAVSAAAMETMGWDTTPHPHQVRRMDLPPNGLHLRLSTVAREGDDGEPDAVTGVLTKMFPISDVSGTRIRMERVGSPAAFRVTRNHLNWSKHPSCL